MGDAGVLCQGLHSHHSPVVEDAGHSSGHPTLKVLQLNLCETAGGVPPDVWHYAVQEVLQYSFYRNGKRGFIVA